jgi:hypothetical protein
MSLRVISLAKYSQGIGILAGRDRGKAVREAEGLDAVDRSRTPVIVQIPEDVFSVNSSFFLGMFEKSINALGEDEFRRVYAFEGPDAVQTVEDGIRTALLMGTRLRPHRSQPA